LAFRERGTSWPERWRERTLVVFVEGNGNPG